MKLYLDNCCYNRPFDDRSIIKNYLEREAVLVILQCAYEHEFNVIGSKILEIEIDKITDNSRKNMVRALYAATTSDTIQLSDSIIQRSEEIQRLSNIRTFDSLHLASAEDGKTDFFLSTDRKLINACRHLQLSVKVQTPIEFLGGYLK